jgi:hypothetical protein
MRREVFHNILIEFEVPMKLVRLIRKGINEIYSKVRIGKHLSGSFPIQIGLKQRDALSPPFFNFALEYGIRKVQDNQVVLKLNGTHQLLAYADNVNLLGDNIDTVKKNRDALIDASKRVGLVVNAERTKYMAFSRHRKAGQTHDSKIGNVAQIKYLRTMITEDSTRTKS